MARLRSASSLGFAWSAMVRPSALPPRAGMGMSPNSLTATVSRTSSTRRTTPPGPSRMYRTYSGSSRSRWRMAAIVESSEWSSVWSNHGLEAISALSSLQRTRTRHDRARTTRSRLRASKAREIGFHESYADHDEARWSLFEYIEVFYDRLGAATRRSATAARPNSRPVSNNPHPTAHFWWGRSGFRFVSLGGPPGLIAPAGEPRDRPRGPTWMPRWRLRYSSSRKRPRTPRGDYA